MKVTRHTTEQIITKLREVERLQAEGQSIATACKQVSISEHTFYPEEYRREYNAQRPHSSLRYRTPAAFIVAQTQTINSVSYAGS